MTAPLSGNDAFITRTADLAVGNAKTAQKIEDVKNSKEIARAGDAAQEFESVFVAEMLKPMFEGISTDAPFGGGKGEEVFRGMMLQEYGKIIARSGGVGLADSIKTEMIKMQEQANNAK
jgi:Rod binding domain-containing protein